MSEAAEVRWVLGSGEAAAGAEGCDYDDWLLYCTIINI
jgi:hypothetical protein